jgi:hypothetical protein
VPHRFDWLLFVSEKYQIAVMANMPQNNGTSFTITITNAALPHLTLHSLLFRLCAPRVSNIMTYDHHDSQTNHTVHLRLVQAALLHAQEELRQELRNLPLALPSPMIESVWPNHQGRPVMPLMEHESSDSTHPMCNSEFVQYALTEALRIAATDPPSHEHHDNE